LAVTAYEEKPEEKGEIRAKGNFLNVYVVNDVVAFSEPLLVLPLDVHLIVSRWEYDPAAATKTGHQWLFVDVDRDGAVDNASFQTVVRDAENAEISLRETEISGDELTSVQDYFRSTLTGMVNKARQEQGKGCVPS
jgi:hypothetical protein